jgi:hypothetical protein
MGNLYANIVLRTTAADSVAAALTDLRRRAFIASDASAVVVFDEACDAQDLDELQRLAGALSKRLTCVALASCNHDDDVLWYVLVEHGEVVDIYNSNPSYFDGREAGPTGGDAARLCAAFDVARERAAVEGVLRASHRHVGLEIDRHQALQRLLRLPESLSLLGYRYVQRRELAHDPAAPTLRAVGCPMPHEQVAVGRERSTEDVNSMAAETRAAIEREGMDLMWHSYALALSDPSSEWTSCSDPSAPIRRLTPSASRRWLD